MTENTKFSAYAVYGTLFEQMDDVIDLCTTMELVGGRCVVLTLSDMSFVGCRTLSSSPDESLYAPLYKRFH